jgi:fibronectin-binding autotransporter adhesin
VFVQAGTYDITTFLVMAANTRLQCEAGATINTLGASWTGGIAHNTIRNTNWAAGSITDVNLSVEGCNFTEDATFAADGAFHAVEFQMARHIQVHNNTFTAGGNGTAMLATDDTVVTNNSMTGALNACWDHWRAATNIAVDNNYCDTVLYGTLVTGADTFNTVAGISRYGSITNNRYYVHGSNGAGIWLNGLAPAGSGASNISVTNNQVVGDGSSNFICFKATGLSVADIFAHNTCRNTGTNSQGAAAAADAGGTATNVIFDSNVFDGVQVQSGSIGVIALNGNKTHAYNNRINGGAYPSCVYLSADANVVSGNQCDVGTGAKYNQTGATHQIIIEYDPATGSADFLAGNLKAGGNTISLGGNLTTGGALTQSGAFATTLTSTATTNSTLPAGTHSLAPLDGPTFTGTTVAATLNATTLQGTATTSNANDTLKLGPTNVNMFIDHTAGSNPSSLIFGFNTTKTASATDTLAIFDNATDRVKIFAATSGGTGSGTDYVFIGAPLDLRDTSAAFDVPVVAASSTALTANRTLTVDMKNVAHTIALNATANTITFPNTASYTLIGSGDTGTVTNTMLAGSIAASKLTGTDIATVGALASGSIASGFGSIASANTITTTNATASTSPSTGAVIVTGGVGVGGRLNVGGTINQFGSTTPSHIASGQTTPPALTSCGSGSPTNTGGTDTAGTVTMGTSATGCTITFNVAYTGTPNCIVVWPAQALASQSYTVSNTAITLTQTSTSGNKVVYHCIAPSGG